MGLRFRRSWGVFPGVRLNLGLKSGSVSFGVRGLHYTVGTRGSQVTAGLPGTGLFWTQKIKSPFGNAQAGSASQPPSYLQPTTARSSAGSCLESRAAIGCPTELARPAATPTEPISYATACCQRCCPVGISDDQPGVCAGLVGVGGVSSHRNRRPLLCCSLRSDSTFAEVTG